MSRSTPHRWTRTCRYSDVVQDAVLQTLKLIGSFEHRTVGAAQAYLRVLSTGSEMWSGGPAARRAHSVEALQGDAPSPLEQTLMRQHTTLFIEALQRLRPLDHQAIVWRIELGYSYEEIARRLGKSNAAAARMTVNRALKGSGNAMRLQAPLA